MRRFLIVLAAAALIGPVSAPAAHAASPALERIKEKGAITFAYREGAAPFSFKDREGRVRGYSVDLCIRVAMAVQRELRLKELKIEWIPVNAATRFEAIANGKADAECGTTTITLTRMETVDFSLPIFVDGGGIMVRSNSKLLRVKDLKGKRIAVIAGTTTEQALTRALKAAEAPAILVPVKDGAEGMSQLAKRKVDGYASDRVVLAGLRLRATRPEDFEFVSGDISYEPYGIVVPRNDPEFRLAVNRALANVYRHGDIDPIYQQWLGNLGKPGTLLNAMFYLNTLPE
jgi:glutamate/aspartate transport system substrate-binding protein